MTLVTTALSTSLDGFIAGADDGPGAPLGAGGDALFDWFRNGDTPSEYFPRFRLSAVSARFFDGIAARGGATLTGRRTYDIADAWGGDGVVHGEPVFVLTHRPPDPADVPSGAAEYTYVTDGIESAVAQARAAAEAWGGDVGLMGASTVQQALRAGLLDELIVHLVPIVLGSGVRLLDGLSPGAARFELAELVDAPGVTHLRYRVLPAAG